MDGERYLFVMYLHCHWLLLRLIGAAVFDRMLLACRLHCLLLGWVPYIMVPKATKNDHDGKEREYDRLHNALLFLWSTKHTSCSHRVSYAEIENTLPFIRDILAADERISEFPLIQCEQSRPSSV